LLPLAVFQPRRGGAAADTDRRGNLGAQSRGTVALVSECVWAGTSRKPPTPAVWRAVPRRDGRDETNQVATACEKLRRAARDPKLARCSISAACHEQQKKTAILLRRITRPNQRHNARRPLTRGLAEPHDASARGQLSVVTVKHWNGQRRTDQAIDGSHDRRGAMDTHPASNSWRARVLVSAPNECHSRSASSSSTVRLR